MRLFHTVSIACLLAVSANAQTNAQNHTQIWDSTTEFTSRGSNSGNAGHVGQGYQYGFTAGLENLTRTQYVMQDQNLATREPWDAGTCGFDDQGRPDWGTAASSKLNTYATNLLLPAGSGIGGFLITHNTIRATPHKIFSGTNAPDKLGAWMHAVNLKTASNWSADGLSRHMSQAAAYRGTRLCTAGRQREIPRRDGAPLSQINERLSWTDVRGSTTPVSNNRTWRLVVSFKEVVLKGFSSNSTYNGTCPDPNPGYASIDPNVNDNGGNTPARNDDLAWQLRAGADYADGLGFLFFSTKVFPNGGLPTPIGTLHARIDDPLFAGFGVMPMGTLSTAGISPTFTLPLTSSAAVRDITANIGVWHAQAVAASSDLSKLELSSLWTHRLLTTPRGWNSGSATKSLPFTIPNATATPGRLAIRNDGRGRIVLQRKRGGTDVGPPVAVGERSCVAIDIPAGVNQIVVSSPNNDNPNPGFITEFVYRLR